MDQDEYEKLKEKAYYVPPSDNDHAAPFRKMANDIMHNSANGFGGAVVIVPPDGGGKAVSVLLLDGAQDAAQFWGLIGPKAQIALAEITQQQKTPPGFQRR